jgi:hypothetical protein
LDYFDQVQRAAQSSLYYVALGGALAIPDMCAAMETASGPTTPPLYQAWFDKWVAPKYGGAGGAHLTGLDCYGLRCSMLHQGRLEPHKGTYTRVLFIEPGNTGIVLHNNIVNDALNIDVNIFVNDMVESAVAWHEKASQTTAYRANYARFMQRYPEGLQPYIGGVPVIS